MVIEDLRNYLERQLMLFYPAEYVPKFVLSTRDIFSNRELLKSIKFNNAALDHLLNIVLRDIREKKRFRRIECLKVIRSIIKRRGSSQLIEAAVLRKLFSLYKTFVFDNREKILWCISSFIKDQILEKEEIEWLIHNYKKSVHIVNRLLRYPTKNKLVINWAKRVYLKRELRDRASEVLALLIDREIPSFVEESNPQTLIWGIYYARITDEAKQELLKKYGPKSVYTTVEICTRLGYPAVIEFMLQELAKKSIEE